MDNGEDGSSKPASGHELSLLTSRRFADCECIVGNRMNMIGSNKGINTHERPFADIKKVDIGSIVEFGNNSDMWIPATARAVRCVCTRDKRKSPLVASRPCVSVTRTLQCKWNRFSECRWRFLFYFRSCVYLYVTSNLIKIFRQLVVWPNRFCHDRP
jgi:hypothetical protein